MDQGVKLSTKKRISWGLLVGCVVFAVLFAYLFFGSNAMQTGVDERQLEFVKNTVYRYAVHCYAVEGRYPKDITYLQEHYGLSIDQERLSVYYDYIAANMMPDIYVFAK